MCISQVNLGMSSVIFKSQLPNFSIEIRPRWWGLRSIKTRLRGNMNCFSS